MPASRALRPAAPFAALLSTLASLAAAGCGDDPTPATQAAATEAAPPPPVNADDPTACAPCHRAIVEEWQTSMHASAHHEADPIFGAMRTFRMGRESEALATACARCHSPRAPSEPDGAIARTGVSCATCHQLSGVDRADGKMGAAALVPAEDGALRGPHDVAAGAPAPHGTGAAAPWLTDGRTVCLACHESMRNAQGVATCTTGLEATEGGGDATCASCHMPEVAAPAGAVTTRASHRSHAFLGPHHLFREGGEGPAFMASAVEATATLEGQTLRARLRNRSVHALPTGFPGRVVVIRATAFDADGAEVFRSFRESPSEDPQAVLGKAYVDAAGQPAMPPYSARLARDTRLAPNEDRALEWTLPEGAVRAEVQLTFRLLPPPAAAALELSDSPLAAPRPFLTVSAP